MSSKQLKSVKEHFEALAQETVVVDKVNLLKEKAFLIHQWDVESPLSFDELVQDFVSEATSKQDNPLERLAKFQKAKVGQTIQQTKFDTEFGILHIKRYKNSADTMAVSVALKRENGITAVLEFHDALEVDFKSVVENFKKMIEEGTISDYCIAAYENVVAI